MSHEAAITAIRTEDLEALREAQTERRDGREVCRALVALWDAQARDRRRQAGSPLPRIMGRGDGREGLFVLPRGGRAPPGEAARLTPILPCHLTERCKVLRL